MRGLDGSIVTDRRSRYNYGTVCEPPFDPALHPVSSKYYDHLDECFRADSIMEWYVRKNDLVTETRAIPMEYSRTFEGEAFPRYKRLVVSESLFADAMSTPAVICDHVAMAKICTLTADLNQVPRECFELMRNSKGTAYWSIEYTLEMVIDSSQLDFRLKVDGESYGSVKAIFNE